MLPAHEVDVVRAAEVAAYTALPPGALMQRAAAGLAAAVLDVLGGAYGRRVVLLAGGGDNGGDALWAGVRLARRGAAVTALTLGSPRADGAEEALRAAGGRVVPAGGDADAEAVAAADVVVDGLVGIGGRGGLRPEAARLAALAADALVVAVDLPSGVDADTGQVPGAAVRADVTVTFGSAKPGLLVTPGAGLAGEVRLVDIGLGPHLPAPRLRRLDGADVAGLLPVADLEATKYTRGVAGVAAGSEAYPGAAVLCTGGALRAGAGMVRYAGTPHPAEQVRARWPEAVVTEADDGPAVVAAGRVQAWVVGPGLGTDDRAASVVEAVLASDVPVVVDADGTTVLAQRPELRALLRDRRASTVLTPHAGEFERLTGVDPAGDRLGAARRAADGLAAVVLLKGATTVVAEPGGTAYVNGTGTARLATAGSGDVLAGALGAYLAQGLPAPEAAAVAAHLHGLAALAARPPVVAEDLVRSWPDAVALVRGAGDWRA